MRRAGFRGPNLDCFGHARKPIARPRGLSCSIPSMPTPYEQLKDGAIFKTFETNMENLKSLDWQKMRWENFGDGGPAALVDKVLRPSYELLLSFDGAIADLPLAVAHDLSAVSGTLWAVAKTVVATTPSAPNYAQVRNSWVEQARSAMSLALQASAIARSTQEHRRIEEGLANVREVLTLTQKALADIESKRQGLEAIDSKIADMDKRATIAMQRAEDAAAKAGVAKYSEAFGVEAKRHRRAAYAWLVATVLAVGLTVGGAAAAVHWFVPDNTWTPKVAQEITLKILAVSALSYLIVFSARGYRANRHNATVNKHRQNALTTFEKFVAAAESDQATKNAVLLQATTAVFSPQPSGYSDHDDASPAVSINPDLFKGSGHG